MIKKIGGLILTIAFLLIGLIGCEKPIEKPRRTIGVTLLARQHWFYRKLESAFRDEAEKFGDKLLIFSGEFNATTQAGQIEYFIAKKVDAIIICPCDSFTVGTQIAEVNAAGIPVFTVDIANRSGKGEVVTHIASDNVEGGRIAARLLARAIQYKGKIVGIDHVEVSSARDRLEGFKKEMKNYPEIEIVDWLSAGSQRIPSMRAMQVALEKFPDIKGVFGTNDATALGALSAIELASRVGQVAIVGFDATPEARKAVAEGKFYGDVIQYPEEMGRRAIQVIHDYLSGRKVPKYIATKVKAYIK